MTNTEKTLLVFAGLILLPRLARARLGAISPESAAINKYYDTDNIKPYSRVDRYWGVLNIVPRHWGVELRKEKYFVEPPEAVKHFNLHSIEFGNWTNQEERQGFMYATLVTLRDIGEITGIPQSKLGMRKKLALAFGARGHGGNAAAFYLPEPYHLINLTKTKGRGTFCHEYGHAIDYYLGGHSGRTSTRKQPNYTGLYVNSVAYLFEKVMDVVLWNDDGAPSSYHNWLLRKSQYYNQRNEIWARVFETYCYVRFKEKGIYNTWGVDRGLTDDLPDTRLVKKAMPYIQKIIAKLK